MAKRITKTVPAKQKRPRTFRWFLEPCGMDANGLLFRTLGQRNDLEWQQCNDGKEHYLYECDNSKLLKAVLRSAEQLGLDLKVWRQRSKNSQIEPSPFHGKGKLKRRKSFGKGSADKNQRSLFRGRGVEEGAKGV